MLAVVAALPVPAATPKPESLAVTAKPEAAATTPTAPVGKVEVQKAPSKATMVLLEELEKRHGSDKTVHAVFTQIRRDESMEMDISSSGTLWFKRNPEKFRCDYINPQPMITLMTDEKFYVYTKEFNQVDFYQFETAEEFHQQLDTLMLGFGLKATDLVRRYEIYSSEGDAVPLAELKKASLSPEKTALLYFTPKPAFQEQSPFTQLKVFIDKGKYLPEKIWYVDPQGNVMRIQLRKIDLGAPIDDNLFKPSLVFPASAKFFNKRDTNSK